MKKFMPLIFVLTFLTIGVTSCGEEAIDSVDKTVVLTPKYWPLTGVEGNYDKQPVVSVKIPVSSNSYYGLNDADIVIQQVLEGSIPRYIGIFQSKIPSRVQPIRSTRMMDGPTLGQLGGMFVSSSGGHAPFKARVKKDGLQTWIMDDNESGFIRDSSFPAPDNVYINLKDVLKNANDSTKTFSGTPFFSHSIDYQNSTAALFGKDRNKADVQIGGYYSSQFTWDPTNSNYKIKESGGNTKDAKGAPLTTENVVVLYTSWRPTAFKDPAGNPEMEDIVVGSGKGAVYSSGKYIPIKWSKESDTAPFVFTPNLSKIKVASPDGTLTDATLSNNPDLQDLLLSPGRTWINWKIN